jgi:Flp pilus assembly protein TadG
MMKHKPTETTLRRARRQAGNAMITVLVALVALIAMSSLAIDGGMIWAARNQLQNAVDAAALAAAWNMIDPAAPVTTLPVAQAAALDQAADHRAANASAVAVQTTDVTFGQWDFSTRTLDTSVDLTDPRQVDAVEVRAALDGVANGPLPAMMARVLGRSSFDVAAEATAYLGFVGGFAPETLFLPIVIDCCKLKGFPACDQDYCETVETNPPNPCSLSAPQTEGANTVSCLEFHNTPDQNACWTVFDGDTPAINTPDLTSIIRDGNGQPVSGAEPIYLDNGTKTPVISDIYDKFMGEGYWNGEDPAGQDRYQPKNGPDSWVVGFPVVECQSDGEHCASGSPQQVVGGVCFEIREVLVNPEKIIKGRFLCEGDPLMEFCDLGGLPGGDDFDVRATIPVLVY